MDFNIPCFIFGLVAGIAASMVALVIIAYFSGRHGRKGD